MDLGFKQYQQEFEDKALEVLRSGWYILGRELEEFEKEFASFTGAEHCIGVANGLDAIRMAFQVLNIGNGDEVIVQGNTFIASVMGISMNNAIPVFIEPDEYNNIDVTKIEEKITNKTKAILVVHLYGQASDMEKIMQIAHKYDLKVVEDCAQSHGAFYKDKMTGTFGDISCYSFYPTKNLGAFGDAGAILTDNEELAKACKLYRNYGSEKKYYNKVVGTNSRLDEMQAGLLRVRLKHIDELTKEREAICARYLTELNNKYIELPKVLLNATTVWHQFVIKCLDREALVNYLEKHDIGILIHYPIPPHLSEAYQYLGYKAGSLPITEKYADTVLSLPLYNGMSKEELDYVIEILNKFEI
jgi:dTDP-4-amino-4,6-dideoxygalactose transaminase